MLSTEKIFGVTIPSNGLFAAWFSDELIEPLGGPILRMSDITEKVRSYSFINGILQSIQERDSDYILRVKDERAEEEKRLAEDEKRQIWIKNANALPISRISWKEVSQFLNRQTELTYDERNTQWEMFEGKKVQWQGFVMDVIVTPPDPDTLLYNARSVLGEYTNKPTDKVVTHICMVSTGTEWNVELVIKDAATPSAKQLRTGDKVTFTGICESYDVLIPIKLIHGSIQKRDVD